MAWWKRSGVVCNNFPKGLLPLLAEALENGQAVWVEKDMVGFNTRGRFSWMGCLWHIEENGAKVASLTLEEGDLDNEDLTALILRG